MGITNGFKGSSQNAAVKMERQTSMNQREQAYEQHLPSHLYSKFLEMFPLYP